jgi:hypothetical protein
LVLLDGFAAFLLVVGGPLWLTMRWIHRRAQRARVSPIGAFILAFFGYFFGTAAANFGAFSLVISYSGGNLPGLLIFPTLLVGSCAGSVVGSGAGYVFIWVRTTDDPDYEDRFTGRSRPPAG